GRGDVPPPGFLRRPDGRGVRALAGLPAIRLPRRRGAHLRPPLPATEGQEWGESREPPARVDPLRPPGTDRRGPRGRLRRLVGRDPAEAPGRMTARPATRQPLRTARQRADRAAIRWPILGWSGSTSTGSPRALRVSVVVGPTDATTTDFANASRSPGSSPI